MNCRGKERKKEKKKEKKDERKKRMKEGKAKKKTFYCQLSWQAGTHSSNP